MAERGEVRAVAFMPMGSELQADVTIGALTLTVDNSVDFDEDGGSLAVNGLTYDYTTIDHDTGILTLASALTVAAVAGDRINVWSGGQIATEYTAFVSLGDGDEVEVPIPYGERDLWPEGEYLSPVLVDLSDDLESMLGVPGRTPLRDGTFIDPLTAPTNAATQAALDANAVSITNLNTGLATKASVYVQATAPTGSVVGDTWYDTSAGNRVTVWNGTSWVARQDTAIATAQTAATTAQTTANGKNKVTYSSVASPGVTANTAGDIWFRTSSGLVIEQWQGNGGTSWTQVTLDNAVIATLDAAKITTGFIAAARIQAGTITANKLLVTVGGGNLLSDSSFETGAVWSVQGAATITSDTARVYRGSKSMKVVVTNGSSFRGATYLNALTGAQVPGGTYTVSAWVYPTTAMTLRVVAYDGAQAIAADTACPANTWTRMSATGAVTTSANPWQIIVDTSTTAQNGTFNVDAVQFEQGDLPTAYSPKADEVLPGTIVASMIATDTITANQIATGAITAAEILAGAVTTTAMTANTILGDRITVNTLNADRIVANSITTGQLSATAIDGMVITGAQIRTAASGQRLDITSSAGLYTRISFYTGAATETAPAIIDSEVSNATFLAPDLYIQGPTTTTTPAGAYPIIRWIANTSFASLTANAGAVTIGPILQTQALITQGPMIANNDVRITQSGSGGLTIGHGGGGSLLLMVTHGSVVTTTNASGITNIAHGMGRTPYRAFLQARSVTNVVLRPTGFDATNIQVEVRNVTTNAVSNGTSQTIDWLAFA